MDKCMNRYCKMHLMHVEHFLLLTLPFLLPCFLFSVLSSRNSPCQFSETTTGSNQDFKILLPVPDTHLRVFIFFGSYNLISFSFYLSYIYYILPRHEI